MEFASKAVSKAGSIAAVASAGHISLVYKEEYFFWCSETIDCFYPNTKKEIKSIC